MSKAVVDQFLFKAFIILLAFDVISVVYLTPKAVVVTPVPVPEESKQTTQQSDQEVKQTQEGHEDEEDDPYRTTKSDDVTGTVIIQYCTSHQAALDAIKTHITDNYPSVVFESSLYPLDPIKSILSKFLQYIHWIMLALNLFGDKIFGFLQMPYPQWYVLMKEKKMIVLGVVLVGSMFLSGIVNKTDAFEVFLDGELVHSKFGTGVVPTPQTIDSLLSR